ncbi:MAG TPA: ABC transporter substrate-binding protein [Gammaproteobacteria bacterium]|nr:ABC transporter substrate-binding protein [Gammaproteobacteria bacterium]
MPLLIAKPPSPPYAQLCQLVVSLGCALLLTACDQAGSSTQKTIKSLVYATDREPICLDPHVRGDMPQAFLARQFLDSLVSMNKDGTIGPWLATRWEVSPDGLSYTFHLRNDVRFTDGTAFNAQALKANFEHMTNPKTQSVTAGGYLRQYVGTDVVDEYTAVVHLKTPYAAFLEVLAQPFLGIESPTALQRPSDVNCASPVGSGPFKVASWERQSQVALEKNPDYNWAPPTAKHNGPAYLDRIVWKFIAEPSVRFASLQSGEVDIIDGLPPESHAPTRQNPDLSLVVALRPGNPTNGTLNTRRAPFDDLRVREAFVRSANIDAALNSVFFGEVPRASGPLSSTTPFYSADFTQAQGYDPERANRLLDEAGWTARDSDGYRTKDGKRLTVHLLTSSAGSPADLFLWEQVQATARQTGFELQIERLSDAQLTKRHIDWDYDIRVMYWNTNTADVLRIIFGSAFIDGANAGGYHQNTSGYSDTAFDSTVEHALETQDAEKRRALYRQAQAMASAQFLQLLTYPQSTRLGIRKTTRGVSLESSMAVVDLYDTAVDK